MSDITIFKTEPTNITYHDLGASLRIEKSPIVLHDAKELKSLDSNPAGPAGAIRNIQTLTNPAKYLRQNYGKTRREELHGTHMIKKRGNLLQVYLPIWDSTVSSLALILAPSTNDFIAENLETSTVAIPDPTR